MLHLLFAALLVPSVSPPKSDATCHGSFGHLATDNIPMTASDRDTTIVNIWYVARSRSAPALYWVYQLFNGRRFVQANADRAPDMPFDARAQRYVALNRFGVYPCFSQPFPTDQL